MRATRQGDKIVLELTPQESHIIIWGGPVDVVKAIDHLTVRALAAVEDHDFTDAEYGAMFGAGLDATYETLRREIAVQGQ